MAASRRQADIASLNDPGLYRFDKGLFLQVRGEGSKSWIFRYTVDGKPRWMGVGSAGEVTFAKARDRVLELRVTQTGKKIDPLAEKERAAAQAKDAERKAVPFRQRVEEYIAAHQDGWRSPKHREQWRSSLSAYAYPAIGDLPAVAVTGAHVVDILRPIWKAKPETARRVRSRIAAVLDYAADPDDSTYRNPASLSAHLLKKLPRAPGRGGAHHPSLPYADMPAFYRALLGREGMARSALAFVILTATSTQEVLGARWEEIDRNNKLWMIPAHRMKAGRAHAVPLSAPALELLESVAGQREYIFPAVPTDSQMSNMAMLALLRRMGRADITVHGFRSTFRTWAAECTTHGRETAEFALAHAIEDKTEAAYQRGDLLDKRRLLMGEWASYCARVPACSFVM